MSEIAKADLSQGEAKSLTDKIRKSVDGLWSLLLEAYERKAWKALEYRTWETYVKAEFDMSRRRSYQLVDQGRVIRAIKEVTGENVQHVAQISARDTEAVKDDLPSVTAKIKSRLEQGETTEKAVADVVAEKREERQARGKKPEPDNSRREEVHGQLSPEVQRHIAATKAAKAESKQPNSSADAVRIKELEETVAALEAENTQLRDELKKFEAMKLEFERGGFAEVISGLGEQIRVLKTRVERESQEKVKNLRSADRWRKKAIEHGYSRNTTIDLETGEVING
jgi:hypothetical protein